MKVNFHPPLLAAGADWEAEIGAANPFFHALLWLDVEVEAWEARRSGHLHVVAEFDHNDWRVVDLSRVPLRPWHGESHVDEAALRRLLERRLDGLELELYRIEALGLTSELGEGIDTFRRRALGRLRPEVQSMVDSADGGQRGELARRMAELSGSIDRWRCPDPRSAVKRAEIGTLWVAEGLDLQPPQHRSLML